MLTCILVPQEWFRGKVKAKLCETSSSHGGEYEAQNLLGCTAVFLAGHGNHLSTPLKYVETPPPRPRSKLSHLSSGQLSPPPVRPVVTPNHILAPSRFPQRPYKGTNSILSHSHTIPLSVFYFRPPTHLPLVRFLAYCHSFPIGQLRPLDSYTTSDLSR
jgi:hypothetical protein